MPHFHASSAHDMTEQLDHGRILPLVFRLTVPAVVAQLITFLYNILKFIKTPKKTFCKTKAKLYY